MLAMLFLGKTLSDFNSYNCCRWAEQNSIAFFLTTALRDSHFIWPIYSPEIRPDQLWRGSRETVSWPTNRYRVSRIWGYGGNSNCFRNISTPVDREISFSVIDWLRVVRLLFFIINYKTISYQSPLQDLTSSTESSSCKIAWLSSLVTAKNV